MKVYHEKKIFLSESKVGKLFKRKGAVKPSFLQKTKKEKRKGTGHKMDQALNTKTTKDLARQEEDHSSEVDTNIDPGSNGTSGHDKEAAEQQPGRVRLNSLVSDIISSSDDEVLQAMLLKVETTGDTAGDRQPLSPKPPLAEEEHDSFSLHSSSKSSFEGSTGESVGSRDRTESTDSLEHGLSIKRDSVAIPDREDEGSHTEEDDLEHLEEEREKAIEVLKHLPASKVSS